MIEEVLPMTRNFKSKILVDIFSKMTSNEKILSELEFFSDNIVESDSKGKQTAVDHTNFLVLRFYSCQRRL